MTVKRPERPRRVLAVASAGGHFEQLLRLRPAFEGHAVTFVTTMPGLARQHGIEDALTVRDASRTDKLAMIVLAVQLLRAMIRIRPHVVVTTGAAPGILACAWAKALGRRSLWIDSIANGEELSMSGRLAGRFATEQWTQWPELSETGGPAFHGRVF